MTIGQPADKSGREYIVVARRYRPQRFSELVGQNQVAHALSNAINTNRVGHAYLFTGARGVGKTSTARILAKSLNCEHGPTPNPCNRCDICEGVASGEDIDVLEIDGASNRGIDEIRQLRSNVNVRPSRARFKIYIIDEVHMLTTQAFNALLKTLEEPPEHVKFIFCTTDVEKIPITVLSRCQRFDFPPVETRSILARLQQIVEAEQTTAEPEALQLIARRAAGSMRDSQSLLEQLLAFAGNRITVDAVHQMLGTARGGSLSGLVAQLLSRDAAGAMRAVDVALQEGVDAGQLAEQLLGVFRDMLAATVGCPADMMLHTTASDYPMLAEQGGKFGAATLLAMLQILDQAVVKMRQSVHLRTLLEIAVIRICHLEQLEDLGELIRKLGKDGPIAAPAMAGLVAPSASEPIQKKNELTNQPPPDATPPAPSPQAAAATLEPVAVLPSVTGLEGGPAGRGVAITGESARELWEKAVASIDDITADLARFYSDVAIGAPDRLVVRFSNEYNLQKQQCERADRKGRLEQALSTLAGRKIQLSFEVAPAQEVPVERRIPVNRRQRMRESENHPLVEQARLLFDAEVLEVSENRRPAP